MNKKTITIGKKQLDVGYCFATEITFHKYTGEPVTNFDAANPEHSIYLILAAAITCAQAEGKDAELQDTDLMYSATPTQIVEAMKTILELRNEWYEVPAGETKEEEKPADPKNG